MNTNSIKTKIEPLRQELLNHSLYSKIQTIDDLHIFLTHHVYAVWDFMSLLKGLQIHYVSKMSEVLDLALLNEKVSNPKVLN